jgi:hypothetical protein
MIATVLIKRHKSWYYTVILYAHELPNAAGYRVRVLSFGANRTPLFGQLDLRNPNSLDLADTIAPFSQYSTVVSENGVQ